MNVYGRQPIDHGRAVVPRGQVYLIPERCKECGICVRFCPQQVLQVSEQTNSKGYHYPQLVATNGQTCVHCQFCSLVCPEFAIFTRELADSSSGYQKAGS
jgi:2-oxoglutarate ferredoxin oxidoreductase subunit delta